MNTIIFNDINKSFQFSSKVASDFKHLNDSMLRERELTPGEKESIRKELSSISLLTDVRDELAAIAGTRIIGGGK